MLDTRKNVTSQWFAEIRGNILAELLKIEEEYAGVAPEVIRKKWRRASGGGGESGVIRGKVFEKAGVNVSTVYGKLSENFAKEIPGSAESEREFWASGISLVIHAQSPLVPTVHMNTRMIATSKSWFGGGMDLTPIYPDNNDTYFFHGELKKMCDKFDPNYYPRFKKECDDYFFLKHRNEPRGVGGIFYDYLNSDDWNKDFAFTQEVSKVFLATYSSIVRRNMHKEWTAEQRDYQLVKRGRYVEFNLLYDRGTKFGLMTGGNTDAIMMSMPPLVKWE